MPQDTEKMKDYFTENLVLIMPVVGSALARPFSPLGNIFRGVSAWLGFKKHSHPQILRLLAGTPKAILMEQFLTPVSPIGRWAEAEQNISDLPRNQPAVV